MRRDIDQILDDCITVIMEGQATLEECLARYPAHADELRPHLEIALDLSRTPRPASSPEAFSAGKARMLARLAERRPGAPGRHRRLTKWIASRSGKLCAPLVRRFKSDTKLLSAAILTLLALTAGIVLLILHLGSPVIHTATLVRVRGDVQLLAPGSETWRSGSQETIVEGGTRIRTGPHAAAELIFFDGSRTTLGEETDLVIEQMRSRRDGRHKVIVLSQRSGCSHSRVQDAAGAASRFEIETPAAVVVVRAGECTVNVQPGATTSVAAVEGEANVTAQGTTVSLTAGEETTIRPSHPPAPASPVPIPPPRPSCPPTVPPTRAPTATAMASQTPLPAPTEAPSQTPAPAPTGIPPQTPASRPTSPPAPTPVTPPTQPSTPTKVPSQTPVPAPTEAPSQTPAPQPTSPPVPTRRTSPTQPPVPTEVVLPTRPPIPTAGYP